MRILGFILSLGLVLWVLYQAAGGDKAVTAIPAQQQQALDKAKGLEDSLMQTMEKGQQQREQQ